MTSRRELIQRELDAYNKLAEKPTEQITFRGQEKSLPIISIKPDQLLLNHRNNRLSGQLIDSLFKEQVESAPDSSKAQDSLSELLRQTEEFNALKAQLKDSGQIKPGLITRDGLLVNGNTRAVALIDLGVQHIKVAVLPDNANESDVFDLEMTLQVSNLVHQDYTFTNELLLMRRFLDEGRTEKELASKMNWKTRGIQKVQLHMRMLKCIEDVRELTDRKISYSFFNNKFEHLNNLDKEYQSLRNQGDIAGAEEIKWTRLAMTYLGLNKDQVRAIKPGFMENKVIPRLESGHDELDEKGKKFIDSFVADNSIDIEKEHDDLFSAKSSKLDMKKFLKEATTISSEEEDDLLQHIEYRARRVSAEIIDEVNRKTPKEDISEIRSRLATVRSRFSNEGPFSNDEWKKINYDIEKILEEIKEIQGIYDIGES